MIEITICPACSEPQRRFLFATDRYNLVQCQGCGLIYKSHAAEPVWETLIENLYNNDFVQHRRWAQGRLRRVASRRLNQLRDYLPAHGRILEIGCGTGEFLETALRQGYCPEAVEPAKASCRWVSDQLKIPCHGGTLAQLPPSYTNYDAVVAFHVLEHQTNAVDFVKMAAARLKPTGVLFLEMPCWDCLEKRIWGHLWNMVNIADHFTFFNEATWRQLAGRAGLNTLAFQTHEAYWEWVHAAIFAVLNVSRINKFGQPGTFGGNATGKQTLAEQATRRQTTVAPAAGKNTNGQRSLWRQFAAQELPARLAWLASPLGLVMFHYMKRRNLGTEMSVIARKADL